MMPLWLKDGHARRVEKRGCPLKIGKDHQSARKIEKLLLSGYSPYAAHVLLKDDPKCMSISVSTLYNYLHEGVLGVGEDCMVHGFWKQKKDEEKPEFDNRRNMKSNIEHISIEERPKSVLSRNEFGHWEGDTVHGMRNKSGAVLTLLERKTRMLVSVKIPTVKKSSVLRALDKVERRFGSDLFDKVFKSITFDNGMEFRDTESMHLSTFKDINGKSYRRRGMDIYFAHPFCSSERGSNENVHRFIRRKFPKGTDFLKVRTSDYDKHIDFINRYPRKIFKGKSADYLFNEEIRKLIP